VDPSEERWGRRARAAGAAVLAALLLASPLAMRVGVDNRLELWVEPGSELAARYDRFRASFGSDEFVLVGYSGGDLFALDALAAQRAALEGLEALPHVRRVQGIPALHRDLFDGRRPDALRRELLDTPFYRGFLVGADGRTAGLLVETDLPAEPAARRTLVGGVRGALAPLERAGWSVHVVGPPVLNAALDATSMREAARSFPVALAASLAILAVLLRSWRATLVAAACAGLTMLCVLELIGAAGRSLNMLTSLLPSLLWVLGVAGVVHFLRRFQAERTRPGPADAALARALRATLGPAAVSAVTTALGFVSLGTSGMTPVRELGVFAAAGMLGSLLVNLTVGPCLAAWLRVPGRAQAPDARTPLRLVGIPLRRPVLVLAASALLVAPTLPSLGRVRVESDPLSFLPADSTLVQDYAAVARSLTGYYSLELVVDAPSGWLDPAHWPALERLKERVEAAPGVARVLSPLDLLKQLNHGDRLAGSGRYELPASRADAAALLDGFDPLGAGERSRLVADGGRSVRLSALVNVMPASELRAIEGRAREALADLPPPLSGHATGLVLQLVDAQLRLVATQIRSFGFAFLTVFACLLAGLRSWRLMAAGVLPNVIPVLAAFAAMDRFGVALDPATVMTASVVIGIAVDDTAHLLSAYRGERGAGRGAAEAIGSSLARTGPAMLAATASACAGFFALSRSAFVPIRWFGLLSGFAMLVGLVAEVFLVPATLVLAERARERRA
jgi:hypothetical protein